MRPLMFALRIEDRSGTRTAAVPAGRALMGSCDHADLHIEGEGVVAEHALLESEGSELRLDALAQGVTVHGEPLPPGSSRTLEVGDRIAIGAVELRLGRRRAPDPEPREPQAVAPRPRRSTARRPKKSPWTDPVRLSLVTGALAVVLVLTLWMRDGVGPLPSDWPQLNTMFFEARFDDARAQLDSYAADWAGEHPERRAMVREQRQRITEAENRVAQLRRRLVAERGTKTLPQQRRELTELRRNGGAVDRAAARAALDQLIEWHEIAAAGDRDRSEPPAQEVPPAVASVTGEENGAEGGQPSPQPEPQSAGAAPRPTPESPPPVVATESVGNEVGPEREDLRSLLVDARYGSARALVWQLEECLPEAARDAALELTAARRRDELLLIERMKGSERIGNPDAYSTALDELRRLAPAVENPRAFARTLSTWDRRGLLLSAGDDPREKARAVGARGDRGEAIAILEDALRGSRGWGRRNNWRSEPGLRRELALQRGLQWLQQALEEHEAELRGQSFAVGSRGETRSLARIRDGLVEDRTGRLWSLEDLDPQGVEMLLRSVSADWSGRIGAAALAYRQDRSMLAEQMLARVGSDDREVLERVQGILRAGRSEWRGSQRYVLWEGVFAADSVADLPDAAQRAYERLQISRGQPADWTRELREILRDDAEAVEVAVLALRRVRAERLQELGSSHPLRRRERILEAAKELQTARREFFALLLDRERYFYPCDPPAVTVERAGEYRSVQSELEQRVRAIRRVWNRDLPRMERDLSLDRGLRALLWCQEMLARLGEDPGDLPVSQWMQRHAPGEGATLGFQRYCRDLSGQQDPEALSSAHDEQLQGRSEERSLLGLINRYRLLLGLKLLRYDAGLSRAAETHCAELVERGELDHLSRDPERRTFVSRVRAEGLEPARAELLAEGGADEALLTWTASSRHHRLLLDPEHRSIGLGRKGDYWVVELGGEQR